MRLLRHCRGACSEIAEFQDMRAVWTRSLAPGYFTFRKDPVRAED